jgi:NIPSNAP
MSSPSQESPRPEIVYELRTYHSYPDKLANLMDRFRLHTIGLFHKHGITDLAFWTPIEGPLQGRTLIYLLQHPSRDAAKKSWKAFAEDPEWIAVKAASEANGKLVESIDSTFMTATEFSPQRL